jgi:hypothetical protein
MFYYRQLSLHVSPPAWRMIKFVVAGFLMKQAAIDVHLVAVIATRSSKIIKFNTYSGKNFALRMPQVTAIYLWFYIALNCMQDLVQHATARYLAAQNETPNYKISSE